MVSFTESSPFAPRYQVRSPMSKALTILGMVVAGLVGVVFALDLAAGFPFSRANVTMDVGAIIAAAILGYLAWDALRDVR
jgi:hypothetical protein